jgi:GNAT superfamily N-acetyltransferase
MNTRTISLPPSAIPGQQVIELTLEHVPLVHAFFEANPEYFLTMQGEPARPDEAEEELRFELPAGLTCSDKMIVGYLDDSGALAALASIVVDFVAARVWHVGFFIVATARHGSGEAQAIHRSLERWAAANGAQWLRLGVVQGNARAERFWMSLGYRQVRTRDGVEMGKRINTLRVMVKPLVAGSVEEYLSLVPRDCPEC